MGRFLAHNPVQSEHCERKPLPQKRRFELIAGGKLLDANREPGQRQGQKTETSSMFAPHSISKSPEPAPKCKGLFFKHDGKWDQMWMVKWLDWYKYVLAFSRKYFSSGTEHNPVSSRAENAKTAWSS